MRHGAILNWYDLLDAEMPQITNNIKSRYRESKYYFTRILSARYHPRYESNAAGNVVHIMRRLCLFRILLLADILGTKDRSSPTRRAVVAIIDAAGLDVRRNFACLSMGLTGSGERVSWPGLTIGRRAANLRTRWGIKKYAVDVRRGLLAPSRQLATFNLNRRAPDKICTSIVDWTSLKKSSWLLILNLEVRSSPQALIQRRSILWSCTWTMVGWSIKSRGTHWTESKKMRSYSLSIFEEDVCDYLRSSPSNNQNKIQWTFAARFPSTNSALVLAIDVACAIRYLTYV